MSASVYLRSNGREVELEHPFVCIHLKGYSLARVTHLDVEHELLDDLIPPKRGWLHEIQGIEGGIEIRLEREKEVEYQGSRLRPQYVQIRCPTLNEVLAQSQRTRTWVGGKFGGIYIGFRKPEIERMERIAREKYGIAPR